MKRTVFIICFTFFLVSCGIFKKSKSIDRVEIKKEKIDLSEEFTHVEIDNKLKDTETTEIIIRVPQTKDILETDITEDYENLQEELAKLIRKSDEVIVRMTKEREQSESVLDTSRSFRNVKEQLEVDSLRKDGVKNTDTTWLANFNPRVILGVAAMIIFAVFLYFRTKRI